MADSSRSFSTARKSIFRDKNCFSQRFYWLHRVFLAYFYIALILLTIFILFWLHGRLHI